MINPALPNMRGNDAFDFSPALQAQCALPKVRRPLRNPTLGKPCGSSGGAVIAFSNNSPSRSSWRYVKTIDRLPRGNSRVRLTLLSPEKQYVEAELRAPGVLTLIAQRTTRLVLQPFVGKQPCSNDVSVEMMRCLSISEPASTGYDHV